VSEKTMSEYDRGHGRGYAEALEDFRTLPTLRDQFAMAALSGLLAADPDRYTDPASYWAKDAYAHADAMLRVREGEG
jgi:hypothetical protein